MRSKAREKLMTFLLKLSFSYVSTVSTSSLFCENGVPELRTLQQTLKTIININVS